MNPARSIASPTPMASNNLPQLGGIDSASRASAGARVTRWTVWPHDASNFAALDPAGPPPITKTSAIGFTLTDVATENVAQRVNELLIRLLCVSVSRWLRS